MEAVLREIRILKELSGHPAVLRFIAAAQMKLPSAGVEFMLLTELCSGGSVADLLKTTRLTTGQALKIFHSASMAVCHMHERKTPITHRDIKIENLLYNSNGQLKLCDFGSATIQMFTPNKPGVRQGEDGRKKRSQSIVIMRPDIKTISILTLKVHRMSVVVNT
ncbi:hypothetical protein KIN20_020341 [Parelaphostrongylus tenuis]|uniref:Protein kinase domain-containing protein n=1 Tax=Parelaphostrongylus tenuis TaxID=148309 RepID=A0AAD5QVH6_PARTN|nr:hypothetical protein KIN20_020341 [Parelaphostrongylus tenuis]